MCVARFSIQGVPKQNERTVREKCIKSQRRGIPFYKTGAQWDKRSILAHQSDFCSNSRQSRQLRCDTSPVEWGRLDGMWWKEKDSLLPPSLFLNSVGLKQNSRFV